MPCAFRGSFAAGLAIAQCGEQREALMPAANISGKQILGFGRELVLMGLIGVMMSVGGAGCRQAVQYDGSNSSGGAQSAPELQTYLEVNYGGAGKDKRGLHAVSGQSVYALDAPIILPTTLSGPISLTLKSTALGGLGYLNGAELGIKSQKANLQTGAITSASEASWTVDSTAFQAVRNQMKQSSDSDQDSASLNSTMTLRVKGEQGDLAILIPVRNPPLSPQVSFNARQLDASQAFQLREGVWALAVGDLTLKNVSTSDLDLHLSRKILGNLLKGYSRTVLSQGDCAIQPQTDSWVSSLSSEFVFLTAGEPVSDLASLSGLEEQSIFQQKIRSDSSWRGTVYAIRQASFGKSFQPEQCDVGAPKMLIPSCETTTCKTIQVKLTAANRDDAGMTFHCDRNGNNQYGVPCMIEGPDYVCTERWISSAAPIPAYDTTNVLGLGLSFSAAAVSGRVNYSDIPLESPHQATELVTLDSRLPVSGSVPFDAPIRDLPAECPLN